MTKDTKVHVMPFSSSNIQTMPVKLCGVTKKKNNNFRMIKTHRK